MIYRIPYGTEMTLPKLWELIQKHKNYVAKYSRPLQDAYENRYEIFRLPAKPPYKPDNRIAVNYAKYITDTFNGFFIGIPVKVSAEDEATTEYIDFLNATNDFLLGLGINPDTKTFLARNTGFLLHKTINVLTFPPGVGTYVNGIYIFTI